MIISMCTTALFDNARHSFMNLLELPGALASRCSDEVVIVLATMHVLHYREPNVARIQRPFIRWTKNAVNRRIFIQNFQVLRSVIVYSLKKKKVY